VSHRLNQVLRQWRSRFGLPAIRCCTHWRQQIEPEIVQEIVLETFPGAPGIPKDTEAYQPA
jgi:hypothetical protein